VSVIHTLASTSVSVNVAAQNFGADGGVPSASIAFKASSCLASLKRFQLSKQVGRQSDSYLVMSANCLSAFFRSAKVHLQYEHRGTSLAF
jgi:hypothetical protein